MIGNVEALITESEQGRQLDVKERRHCIRYLLGVQPDITQVELSKKFHVSETQIRSDIKKIREERAKRLTDDDIKLVIADIVMTFERQVRDIEASKSKCQKGTPTYLKHCEAIFELESKKIKILQDLGFYPKNLGQLTQTKFEFKAVISEDGRITSGNTNDASVVDAENYKLQLEPPAEIIETKINEDNEFIPIEVENI